MQANRTGCLLMLNRGLANLGVMWVTAQVVSDSKVSVLQNAKQIIIRSGRGPAPL